MSEKKSSKGSIAKQLGKVTGNVVNGASFVFHELGVKRAIINTKKGVCKVVGIDDHSRVDQAMYGAGTVLGAVYGVSSAAAMATTAVGTAAVSGIAYGVGKSVAPDSTDILAENVGHLAFGAVASACDFTTGFREILVDHSSPSNNSKPLEMNCDTSEESNAFEENTTGFSGAIQMFSSTFSSPSKTRNKYKDSNFKGDVPIEFKNIELIERDTPPSDVSPLDYRKNKSKKKIKKKRADSSDGIQILSDYGSSASFSSNKCNKKKTDIWNTFDLLDSHEPVFENNEYQEEEFDDWQTLIKENKEKKERKKTSKKNKKKKKKQNSSLKNLNNDNNFMFATKPLKLNQKNEKTNPNIVGEYKSSSSKVVTIDDILNLDQFTPHNANVSLSSSKNKEQNTTEDIWDLFT